MSRVQEYVDYSGDTLIVINCNEGVWFNNTVCADVDDKYEAPNILLNRQQVKNLRRELKLMLKEMK